MTNLLAKIFLLLGVYETKHFMADWYLQFPWMSEGKRRAGWDFLGPLLAHAGMHTLGAFVILLLVAPGLWYLALLDGASHFVIDRIKAGPSYLGHLELYGRTWWIVMGLDQAAHHFVHFYIVYRIVSQWQNS